MDRAGGVVAALSVPQQAAQLQHLRVERLDDIGKPQLFRRLRQPEATPWTPAGNQDPSPRQVVQDLRQVVGRHTQSLGDLVGPDRDLGIV